jgi:hypothetical protein
VKRRLLAAALSATAAAAVAVPAAAPARSVYDPDIGWTTAQRHALHLGRVSTKPCDRDLSARDKRIQSIIDRHGDPREAIRAVFHYRWGNSWYDPCRGGAMFVGVQPSGARYVKAARAIVSRRHLTRYVRFVAVRNTYRELSDETDALGRLYDPLVTGCQLSWSVDTLRNTVVVELARTVSAADRAAIRAHALAAPVNVVVHDRHDDDLCGEPL